MNSPPQPTFTLLPSEILPDSPIGGKAGALSKLSSAGFGIPPWFVVLPDVFTHSASASDPRWKERTNNWPAFREWVAQLDLQGEISEEIQERLSHLFPPDSRFAVRSSAAGEDGTGHSFAGQLDSFLFVGVQDVARSIAKVWASAFSERIQAYLREKRLEGFPEPPGVIVQLMVDAEAAGVAFSADPVSGKRSVAVVAGVWGLGSGLVSGDCDADTWHVSRTGESISRKIAAKSQAHRRADGFGEGVRPEPVPEPKSQQPCLTDEQILAVAALVRKAANFFGRPQDIEWAVKGKELYLLQSRPITSLANLPDPDGAWTLWDNSNIAESYNGVTTPLTFSFARMVYAAVYEQFCLLMAVPRNRIEASRITFGRMLGLVRGRIYYNLLSWYRVLALLPGFKVNRRFMEQMMGVKEGLPAAALKEFEQAPTLTEKVRDLLALGRTIIGLIWNHYTVERQIVAFQKRLQRALRPPSTPLDQMRLDELADHFHYLERELLLRWDAPLVNDFFAMIFFGLLREQSRRWVGDEAGTLPNDLLSGEGGIISTEPARRVRAMAAQVRNSPALVQILCNANLDAIKQEIQKHPEFAAAYRQYLELLGERCLEELKLETVTLEENPLPLLRSVGHAAMRGLDLQNVDETKLRRAAEERLRSALAGHPLRSVIFRWVLRHARARVKSRENLRFDRTRVFGRVRRIFAEMGHRLGSEGSLEEYRDVFYLTVEELLGFVDGTTASTDLRGLANLRKLEFARWRMDPAPADRFETTGAVYAGNPFTAAAKHSTTIYNSEELRGIGCCPGLVRGKARVILQPEQAEIQPGEILVAPRTDPGWILLFPAAAGLLVEHGSLLSHSAIVAREMSIPAVVSLSGLTTWVKNGDWLEMDGATGVVRKIQEPSPVQL